MSDLLRHFHQSPPSGFGGLAVLCASCERDRADSATSRPTPRPAQLVPDVSAVPEILTVEDIAQLLRVSVSTARRLIRNGSCGPWTRMGRRLVVRREALLEAIRGREEMRIEQVRVRKQGERFYELLFGKDEAE